jgi:BMFP domain-containing protein YqiC
MGIMSFVDEILQQLMNQLPEGLSEWRSEAEKHFRHVLVNMLNKLDLVTREEFDAQVKVLHLAREKLIQLQNQLNVLENKNKN